MPKPKKGGRLGGSASHQRKILSNLAAQLITHGAIKTTDAKARLLRPYVEKIITKAKSGTLADRRNVMKLIPNKQVVSYLFSEVAPKFENRNGGYTRIIKIGNRRGDNAPLSRISLVTEELVSAEADRMNRVAASKAAAAEQAEEATEPAAEAPAQEAEQGEAPVAEATEPETPTEGAPEAEKE